MSETALGAALGRLWATIEDRKGADPKISYTARLLGQGPVRCAKKMGEEAIEVVLAAAAEDEKALADEAADLLYHLFLVLASRGIGPEHVAAVLTAREGRSGIREKESRNGSGQP